MASTDPVNHPGHYTQIPGIECIDIVEHMSFNVGNAVKYCWRAGAKGGMLQDIRKAQWYLNREIKRLEAQQIRMDQSMGDYRPFHALSCPARDTLKSADLCTCGGLDVALFKHPEVTPDASIPAGAPEAGE